MQVETSFTGFADRAEGGRRLAAELQHYRQRPDVIVVGLPRGGVITAEALAEELDLPLDVLVVRRVPTRHEGMWMGVIGPGGIRLLNDGVTSLLRIDAAEIEAAAARERAELERVERLYRGDAAPPERKGKTVILVDDGLATGATMAAAIAVIRQEGARRVVLAVPVASLETLARFRSGVDELVYLETPDPFRTVGDWYVDFGAVEDGEVSATMARHRRHAQV